MEIISLQHPNEGLDNTILLHLLLDQRVLTQIHQDTNTQEEQLILFADQVVKLPQLLVGVCGSLSSSSLPQLYVFTVSDVEPVDLVFNDVHRGLTHLELGEVLVERGVVG